MNGKTQKECTIGLIDIRDRDATLFLDSMDEALLPRTAGLESAEQVSGLEQEIVSLFDSLRIRLLRYAISFGLSVHDGEDIVQEVFLALFHHLRQGRSRRNLRGWVFRVTHNLALKRRASNHSSNSTDRGRLPITRRVLRSGSQSGAAVCV